MDFQGAVADFQLQAAALPLNAGLFQYWYHISAKAYLCAWRQENRKHGLNPERMAASLKILIADESDGSIL